MNPSGVGTMSADRSTVAMDRVAFGAGASVASDVALDVSDLVVDSDGERNRRRDDHHDDDGTEGRDQRLSARVRPVRFRHQVKRCLMMFSALPARNQSMCCSDNVWVASKSNVVPSTVVQRAGDRACRVSRPARSWIEIRSSTRIWS